MADSTFDFQMRKAVDAFHAEEMPRTLLMRHIATARQCLVPVRNPGANETPDLIWRGGPEGEGGHYVVYTDPEAFNVARGTGVFDGMPGGWVVVSARQLLASARESDGKGIQINPHTSLLLELSSEEVEELLSISHGSEVDEAILEAMAPPIAPGTLETIAAFSGFEIITRASQTLDLAPDSQGRKLLAVFTSAAGRDAYLASVGPQWAKHGPPMILTLTGIQLAEHMKSLDIDGVVFNCAGPVEPRALHPSLGRLILEAVAKADEADGEGEVE